MSTKEYPIVDNAESFEAALARVRGHAGWSYGFHAHLLPGHLHQDSAASVEGNRYVLSADIQCVIQQ